MAFRESHMNPVIICTCIYIYIYNSIISTIIIISIIIIVIIYTLGFQNLEKTRTWSKNLRIYQDGEITCISTQKVGYPTFPSWRMICIAIHCLNPIRSRSSLTHETIFSLAACPAPDPCHVGTLSSQWILAKRGDVETNALMYDLSETTFMFYRCLGSADLERVERKPWGMPSIWPTYQRLGMRWNQFVMAFEKATRC